MNKLLRLIDCYPEIPYYIASLVFLFNHSISEGMMVFSRAFIFISSTLALGLFVKWVLKFKRPRSYTSMPLVSYDTPSLHTMVSVGSCLFAYILKPVYGLLLTPIAVLYMYSRVKLRYHSRSAVYSGLLLGLTLGWSSRILFEIQVPVKLSYYFSIGFFCLPVFFIYLRGRYRVSDGIEGEVAAVAEESE